MQRLADQDPDNKQIEKVPKMGAEPARESRPFVDAACWCGFTRCAGMAFK